MGVAGQVDQLPDLVLPEHREEGRRVLEVGRHDAVAHGFAASVTVRRGAVVRVGTTGASSRMVSMFGSASSSRSTSAIARRGASARASDEGGSKSVARSRGTERRLAAAVQRGSASPRDRGGAPSGSAALSAWAAGKGEPSKGAEAVFSSVSSLPGSRSEKWTSRSARSAEASTSPPTGTRDRSAEKPVVRADLGDPLELGGAVSQQHEPIRAGVGAVEHAEPDLQVFYGSDGTRTRDLRRDRPSQARRRPKTNAAEQAHLQALFVPRSSAPHGWANRLIDVWATCGPRNLVFTDNDAPKCARRGKYSQQVKTKPRLLTMEVLARAPFDGAGSLSRISCLCKTRCRLLREMLRHSRRSPIKRCKKGTLSM